LKVQGKYRWFDVKALIKFGLYLSAFCQAKKLLLQGKSDFELPKWGKIAVDSFLLVYKLFRAFNFMEEDRGIEDTMVLRKHHLGLAQRWRRAIWFR